MVIPRPHRPKRLARALSPSILVATLLLANAALTRADGDPAPAVPASIACRPAAMVMSYSDALNKVVSSGLRVGGLSDLAWDPLGAKFVATTDRDGSTPARIWSISSLTSPAIVGPPLILRSATGAAYTGADSDNEGLAVLPNGDYVVSSEVEPSIRIFGRDGVQKAQLAVPARFAVAPAGQSMNNATFEGLTSSPSGDQIVAAMEGPLSGDTNTNYRRFLVYDRTVDGTYALTRQVGYAVAAGSRISEVQFYAPGKIVVLEAGYTTAGGFSTRVYAVPTLATARDVSAVANLATQPAGVMAKTLVLDAATCPTMGAKSATKQPNPLMDSFEGMLVQEPADPGRYRVTLISDDNFSAAQTTRILTVGVPLP